MLGLLKPADGYVREGKAKVVFLREGKHFLAVVGEGLKARGAREVTVSVNKGGPAVPGEALLTAVLADGRVMFAQVCQACSGEGPALLWRFGSKPWATDGQNRWLEDGDATPATVLDRMVRLLAL